MRRPIVRVLLGALLTLSSVSLPAAVAPSPVAAAEPTPSAPRTVRFEAGRHVGYTFDMTTGAVLSSKAAVLGSASSALTVERRSIPTRGVHLRISNGTFAGYWIRESIVAHVTGVVGEKSWDPAHEIRIPATSIIGLKFDAGWNFASARIPKFASASRAMASGEAVINGTLHYSIIDGPLAGTWVASGGWELARRLACHTGPRPTTGTAVWSRLTSAGTEVALTFDLGGRTDPALAIAKRLLLNGVCTTIFPTGDAVATPAGNAILEFMDNYPAVFEFGNHTKDHCDLVRGGGDTGCPVARQPGSFVQSQLTSAGTTIFNVTGQSAVPYWRPPYGSHDRDVRLAAAAAGYRKTVMWHIDTIDWKPPPPTDSGPTTVQIIDKVVGTATNGSIVLMHLGGWNTHAALPGMIEGLRSKGLLPTTISDLADGQ